MTESDARARWLEAARLVVADQRQELRCPENQDGDLEVTWAAFPDQAGGEYWLRCPTCGAHNELLIRDHEPTERLGGSPAAETAIDNHRHLRPPTLAPLTTSSRACKGSTGADP